MDPVNDLQKEFFGMWLANLKKKASDVRTLVGASRNQLHIRHLARMLEDVATECDKLYDLGYELGYIPQSLTLERAIKDCHYVEISQQGENPPATGLPGQLRLVRSAG